MSLLSRKNQHTSHKPQSVTASTTGTYSYFIKSDISGIQDFIFNVKSEKAARVLNARSAYIQLYTRIVKEYLLKKIVGLGTVCFKGFEMVWFFSPVLSETRWE